MSRPVPRNELSLPVAVTALMKGVVYRDTHETVWPHLLGLTAQVSDYVGTLGLTVILDEAEGYAYLRSSPTRIWPSSPFPGSFHDTSFHCTPACCWRCCANVWPNSTPPTPGPDSSSMPTRSPR